MLLSLLTQQPRFYLNLTPRESGMEPALTYSEVGAGFLTHKVGTNRDAEINSISILTERIGTIYLNLTI